MLNQYDNPANPGIHELTTGPEIWEDTDGTITHFIAGIGTGGTISGTARYLKSKNPNIKVIAADPIGSSIKTFKETGRLVEALPYLVEGVGQERIPGNLDLSLVDEIINVSDKESFMTARRLGLEEGIFCGGSSGMNVAAALRVAKLLPENAVVVAIICDTGERYLTKHHSDEWLSEKKLLDGEKISLKNVIDAKVRKSLTPAIISASAGMTIGECLSLMSTHEISEIPVIDQGKMVGSVRENKLMGKLLQDRESNGLPVSEIMEEPMPMLKAEEEIQSGIQKLKDYPAIAVEEFGRIVGVITRHDVIEYI
jgi:cystathionine beta-synthase